MFFSVAFGLVKRNIVSVVLAVLNVTAHYVVAVLIVTNPHQELSNLTGAKWKYWGLNWLKYFKEVCWILWMPNCPIRKVCHAQKLQKLRQLWSRRMSTFGDQEWTIIGKGQSPFLRLHAIIDSTEWACLTLRSLSWNLRKRQGRGSGIASKKGKLVLLSRPDITARPVKPMSATHASPRPAALIMYNFLEVPTFIAPRLIIKYNTIINLCKMHSFPALWSVNKFIWITSLGMWNTFSFLLWFMMNLSYLF